MATIRKTIDINASADDVWAKISDIGGISNLIGFIQHSQATGDARVCKMADGGTLNEAIISVDADLRRVVYSITESPLNMSFHVSSMEVAPTQSGARFIWTTDLKPDEASAQMEQMLDVACKDMQSTLAS